MLCEASQFLLWQPHPLYDRLGCFFSVPDFHLKLSMIVKGGYVSKHELACKGTADFFFFERSFEIVAQIL